MKEILLISDTHGNKFDLKRLFSKIVKSDYIFHLGDGAVDVFEFNEMLGEKLVRVSGNCDFFSPLDSQVVVEIEDIKILCCHGHKYQAKLGLERLKDTAVELGVKAVFYGHTHRAAIDIIDGIYFINPGALGKHKKSYCQISINQDNIAAEIKYLT